MRSGSNVSKRHLRCWRTAVRLLPVGMRLGGYIVDCLVLYVCRCLYRRGLQQFQWRSTPIQMQRGIATATIPLHWTPMIPNVRNGLRLLALFPAALPFRVMAHNIPNDAYDFHSIGGHHGTVLCGYFYNGICWYQNYDNAIARAVCDGCKRMQQQWLSRRRRNLQQLPLRCTL